MLATTASASMDMWMPFSTLQWEYGLPGEKFHAVVLARQGKDGMSELTVNAFGKTYVASNDQLDVFRGFQANGVTAIGGPSGARDNERYIIIEFSHRWTQDKPDASRFILIHEKGVLNVGRTEDDLLTPGLFNSFKQ